MELKCFCGAVWKYPSFRLRLPWPFGSGCRRPVAPQGARVLPCLETQSQVLRPFSLSSAEQNPYQMSSWCIFNPPLRPDLKCSDHRQGTKPGQDTHDLNTLLSEREGLPARREQPGQRQGLFLDFPASAFMASSLRRVVEGTIKTQR